MKNKSPNNWLLTGVMLIAVGFSLPRCPLDPYEEEESSAIEATPAMMVASITTVVQ